MTSAGGVSDDYPPSYGLPTYGAVNKLMARWVLVIVCCFFSFLFLKPIFCFD
jgi:hypothetical protein